MSGHEILVERCPLVVVGAGVAGLSAALTHDRAVLLTDGPLGRGGSSPWAQGGIAAAIGTDDSPARHAADTLAVSGELGVGEAVDAVVGGGPAAIDRLVRLGARFDRGPGGEIALGREAAHSRRRIVHADGDATGAEVVRTLVEAVRRSAVQVEERTSAVDLLTSADGVVIGVLARRGDGRHVAFLAGAVVLATGGYAHCFERTTTPAEVIGSGIAMAARADALLADMEFVQFHPTALAIDGTGPLPLLTEALRGEGAVLVDERGERYLADIHPDAELAPRDVVALANYRSRAAGHTTYLDARSAIGEAFPDRFPTVFRLCREHGFDPRTDLLPVTPAAHYCMGGVATDADGRSSLPGLWVIGEAASSGMHGANRLASNSLLEGLVVGRQVAERLADVDCPSPIEVQTAAGFELPAGTVGSPRVRSLRSLLWSAAGVERSGQDLASASAELEAWPAPLDQCERTVHTVARLVVDAATARTESRGAHVRRDHPHRGAPPVRSVDRLRDARRRAFAVVGDRLTERASVLT